MGTENMSLPRLITTVPSIVASSIVFFAFLFIVLPQQADKARQYSSEAGSPDTSFYYTPAQLYDIAEAYGADGRRHYIEARYQFDIIWPLVYTAFLFSTIGRLSLNLFGARSIWRRLYWAPLAGLVFDYAENLSASIVMLRYPSYTPGLDMLSGVMTVLKWVFVNGSFVILILLSLQWLTQVLRNKLH